MWLAAAAMVLIAIAGWLWVRSRPAGKTVAVVVLDLRDRAAVRGDGRQHHRFVQIVQHIANPGAARGRGAQVSARPREIAISPVRAISISPKGRRRPSR